MLNQYCLIKELSIHIFHCRFDNIWLNEGFASYFQYIALEKVQPDWDVMNDFVVSSLQNSLPSDATRNSHPLTNPGVNSYPEIRTLFSTITYDKGGSILRMMHNLMEPGKFQEAIRDYLNERKYSTAFPEDLFTQLEKNDPNIQATEIMTQYTKQPGFPLVTVTRDGDTFKFSQKRFLTEEKDHNITSRWTIPLTMAVHKTDFNDVRSHLTLYSSTVKEDFELEIENTTLNYYVVNVQQVGYYRVNYDTKNWDAIGKALKTSDHGGIHLLNRAQIIDDLFNLARADYLSYELAFDIIDYVKQEKEYLPWLSTFNGLTFLQRRIPDNDYKKLFFNFVNKLLEPIYNDLYFTSKGSHTDKLNRINVLNWACKYENKNCTDTAKQEFENVLKAEDIDPDWMLAVYSTVLRETNDNWDNIWNRYVNSNYATEHAILLTALGCSKQEGDIHVNTLI